MNDIFELGIIGLGPSGIGVAMSLQGTSIIEKTVCFEQGNSIDKNHCSLLINKECCQMEPCHVISGIGGASNNSSGKISDYPAGSGLLPFFESEMHLKSMLSNVINIFKRDVGLKKFCINKEIISLTETHYRHKGITYKYYDVYEFDGAKYRKFISEVTDQLMSEGLCIKMNTEIIKIEYDPNGCLYTVVAKNCEKESHYCFRNIVLCTGSMRINDEWLNSLLGESAASFEIGVRVEGPTDVFKNVLDTHGDLKLKYHNGRTYCVTQNGKIISYRTDGLSFLEGCIDHASMTSYSNFAALIKCDDEHAISLFLNRYRSECGGLPIKQKYTDYMDNKETQGYLYTTAPNANSGNISKLLPAYINKSLREFLEIIIEDTMGLNVEKLTLVAPELKILRRVNLSSQFEAHPGLYVVGAASGKFRGILQSLCSGIQCGNNILRG